MTMVEKVAKAIAESDGYECVPMSEQSRKHYNRFARAAIEAMREEDLETELRYRKFRKQIDVLDNGCWQWIGAIDRRDGYSRFYCGDGKTRAGHQFSYEYHKGLVPSGLVIDHKCRNRSCVNPDHLQVVTNAQNVLSGVGPTARHARATMCGRGHSLENAYIRPDGFRQCRECQRERNRKSKSSKRRAAINAALKEGE